MNLSTLNGYFKKNLKNFKNLRVPFGVLKVPTLNLMVNYYIKQKIDKKKIYFKIEMDKWLNSLKIHIIDGRIKIVSCAT